MDHIEQLTLENMYEKINETPYDFCKTLYWSAQIVVHMILHQNIKDNQMQLYEIECFESSIDEIINRSIGNGRFKKKQKSKLYLFCRYELLSCFPGVYECRGREWDEQIFEIFGKFYGEYLWELCDTIKDLILYVNEHVSGTAAAELITNYLENSLHRYGRCEEMYGLLCCYIMSTCLPYIKEETAIPIYDKFCPYIEKTTDLVYYADVLSMCAPMFYYNASDRACEMLEKAIETRLKIYGEKHKLVGVTYCQLFWGYQAKKDIPVAIDYAIKAYEAFPQVEQTYQLGITLVYLVHCYSPTNSFKECLKWLKIAESIYEKNVDHPESPLLFLELNLAYGNYYLSDNQPELAEKYYKEGIEFGEKHMSGKEIMESFHLNLSILLNRVLGDGQSSKDILSGYLPEGEFIPSGSKTRSLMYLNAVFTADSDDEMEQNAKRGLDEISANPNEPTYVQKMRYISTLLANQKHRSHEKLITQLFSECEAEMKALNIENSEYICELLLWNARFALQLFDYELAEQLAEKALALDFNYALRHEVYIVCGNIFWGIYNNKRAFQLYLDALNLTLSRLNTAKKFLNDSRVRDYLQVIRNTSNYYFSTAKSPKVAVPSEEQYSVMLKTKALPSLIERAKKDASIINAKQAELLEQINHLKNQNTENANRQIQQLEMEYAVEDTAIIHLPEISCKDVQEKLPPRSAIIEFFEYVNLPGCIYFSKLEKVDAYSVYAIFVTVKDEHGNAATHRLRGIDSDDAWELSVYLRKAIESKDDKKITKIRKKLYKFIFSDIYPLIKNCENLYIAPDSDLATIPFEILGTRGYLIDDFKIFYIESGRDIKSNRGFIDMEGVSVVVGNPQYEIEEEVSIKKLDVRTFYRGESVDESLQDLPSSSLEAVAVAEKLGTRPFLRDQATKYVVLNSSSPKVLHIATHGDVIDLDEEEIKPLNPMKQSLLMMAGAVSEGKKIHHSTKFGNGLITADEIAQMDLSNTDLVVLSACVTGLGKKVYSEVVGMRAAFKVAGAKQTVVSLWHVGDFPTAIFMDIFYSLLRNHAVDEALRYAKDTLRTITVGKLRELGWDARTKLAALGAPLHEQAEVKGIFASPDSYQPFTHPADWAGFICQTN